MNLKRIRSLWMLLSIIGVFSFTACQENSDDEEVIEVSATLSLSANQTTFTEGETVSLTLSLNQALSSELSIAIDFSGTANSDDFSLAQRGIIIPADQTESTFSILLTDDDEVEGSETLILTLEETDLPSNVSLGTRTVTLTINDNDQEEEEESAVLSIAADKSSLTEGESAKISVSLDQALSTATEVRLGLSGTTSSDDYSEVSRILNISAGETLATFSIFTTDDSDVEGDETIVVSIQNVGLPENVSIGTETVSLTIVDNDQEAEPCDNDNTINTTDDIGCTKTASEAPIYEESVSGDIRTIRANSVPNHLYELRQNTTLEEQNYTFEVDATPLISNRITSILSPTGRPQFYFGVSLNSVIIAPAPAEPFIFENTQTGEYNWDWVFEPINNLGTVQLDCSYGHQGPQGYHYHGEMIKYIETIDAGLVVGTTTPSEPVHIGWAADGFPIVYKFGPDASGAIKELMPSYELKAGERPGDGVSEPCGPYNGKYTDDYEYVQGSGDLDECNGINQSITIDGQTFEYFYVVTGTFPMISRCFVGEPNDSFR